MINDWAIEFQRTSPRYVCAASVPLLDVDDTVAEMHRAAEHGFKVAFFTTRPPFGSEPYHHDAWMPVWAAADETGTVIGFHIGTEPHTPEESDRRVLPRPGWCGAQLRGDHLRRPTLRHPARRVRARFDRHPDLKVLVSEGGATWGPFLADRMDEGYRQHGFAVRPKLSRLPSEYLYDQVYASFQHDRSAVEAHVPRWGGRT